MSLIIIAVVILALLYAFLNGINDSSSIVATWVILLSALAIAAGTAVGWQRLIRTMGGKFYKIEPIDAFSSQLSSAIVIMTASLTGGPVNATQVISSTIMGVGAGERANKVRWGVSRKRSSWPGCSPSLLPP